MASASNAEKYLWNIREVIILPKYEYCQVSARCHRAVVFHKTVKDADRSRVFWPCLSACLTRHLSAGQAEAGLSDEGILDVLNVALVVGRSVLIGPSVR